MTRTKQKSKPDSYQLHPDEQSEKVRKGPASPKPPPTRYTDEEVSPNLVLSFGVFMFIFSLFIYLQTVYPSLPGGDSGELTVTAKEFGVAHPPGYPLFTMLAYLIIKILPFGSSAFRVNFLSCIFGGLTNTFMGICLLKSTRKLSVALIMCSMMGFSRIFWIWNITGEVFSLNNCICMSTFLVMFNYIHRVDPFLKLKDAYILALLCGLGTTNQHTSSLLIFPTAALVAYDLCGYKEVFTVKNVVGLTLTGISPTLTYIQLPLASYLKTARVSWGDQSTFLGFLFHVLREDYGTLKLVKTEEKGDILLNSQFLLADLHREFTISVLLLAVLGLISLFWTGKRFHWISFLALNVLSYLGFFCSFANIKDISGLYHGVIERFWMQPSLYVMLLAGEGLNVLLEVARAKEPAVLPFAFLIVALRVHSNYGTCDRSTNFHVENFGRHMLSILPQDAILLTSGDLSTNTFRYLTIAEEVRPDVDVLDMSFMGAPWFIPIVGKHMPRVKFPGLGYSPRARFDKRLFDLEMFLDANIGKRPVFVCLKPRKDARSLTKYDMLPYSFCHQFVRKGTVNPLLYGKNMPVPDFDSYLPPPAEDFDEGAWETVVLHEYWDAKVRPGRFLWQMGENAQDVALKKQFYLASFEYLKKTKSDIRKLITDKVISPLSWNHTSYYSKYMGVQCRQLWVYSSKNKDKYYQCQKKYLQEYVDSAVEVTRKFDNDFKNIQLILRNPGM